MYKDKSLRYVPGWIPVLCTRMDPCTMYQDGSLCYVPGWIPVLCTRMDPCAMYTDPPLCIVHGSAYICYMYDAAKARLTQIRSNMWSVIYLPQLH